MRRHQHQHSRRNICKCTVRLHYMGLHDAAVPAILYRIAKNDTEASRQQHMQVEASCIGDTLDLNMAFTFLKAENTRTEFPAATVCWHRSWICPSMLVAVFSMGSCPTTCLSLSSSFPSTCLGWCQRRGQGTVL